MGAISTWSTTAASNNSAAPDGFPEGMNPSDVNNGTREMMAAIKTWYDAIGGLSVSAADSALLGGVAKTTFAYRANNLSDLASAATARTNLGLGSLAEQNTVGATDYDAASIGPNKTQFMNDCTDFHVGRMTANAAGTPVLPAGWSESATGSGSSRTYTLTHGLASTNVELLVVPHGSDAYVCNYSYASNSVTFTIRDGTSTVGGTADCNCSFFLIQR